MKQWNELIPAYAFCIVLRSVLQTISTICEYENTKTRRLQQKDFRLLIKKLCISIFPTSSAIRVGLSRPRRLRGDTLQASGRTRGIITAVLLLLRHPCPSTRFRRFRRAEADSVHMPRMSCTIASAPMIPPETGKGTADYPLQRLCCSWLNIRNLWPCSQ